MEILDEIFKHPALIKMSEGEPVSVVQITSLEFPMKMRRSVINIEMKGDLMSGDDVVDLLQRLYDQQEFRFKLTFTNDYY